MELPGVNIDFRYDTALANVGIINAVPAKGDVGVNGALLVRQVMSLKAWSTCEWIRPHLVSHASVGVECD